MNTIQDIRNAIKKIANGDEELYGIPGTVKSVDTDKRTCVVAPIDYPGAVLNDVRLAGAANGVFLKPSIGSQVVVLPTNKYTGVIVMWSALDGIYIDNDKVVFNGGNNGGLGLTGVIADRLNRLETAFNDLVSKFNSHVHVLTLTSGTGTAAPTVTPESDITPLTVQSDISDTKITH